MKNYCRSAFTLVEILVVVVILAVLAALLFPVFSQARQSALKTTTQGRLHQTCLALQIYRESNNDELPYSLKDMVRVLKLPEATIHCPKSGLEFNYPLNGANMEYMAEQGSPGNRFDPALHAAVRAMYWNTFDCGPGNQNCEVKTYKNPHGETFTYLVPHPPHPVTYNVLAGFLDGHVAWAPSFEDWERHQ